MTEEEWEIVETYVEVLAPINEATTIMSSQSQLTLSEYWPIIASLIESMQDYNSYRDPSAQQLAKSLYENLKNRFAFVFKDDRMKFSTLLDPRYKDRFVNEDEKSEIPQLFASKVKELTSESLNDANRPQRQRSFGNICSFIYSFEVRR